MLLLNPVIPALQLLQRVCAVSEEDKEWLGIATHEVKDVLGVREMGLKAALDVGHLLVPNHLLRLDVDFDVSRNEHELVVHHCHEILDVVLV